MIITIKCKREGLIKFGHLLKSGLVDLEKTFWKSKLSEKEKLIALQKDENIEIIGLEEEKRAPEIVNVEAPIEPIVIKEPTEAVKKPAGRKKKA